MIKMKTYHRSRKFGIVVLALIFLNSVMTLKLRGYQRTQNLNLLRSKLKSESNKDIFDSIEEKSKKEDLILLIGTNLATLIIVAGLDRFGIFEESDETMRENKKKLVKLFL
ncbi:hypothetical protein [Leptotrichia hongkongensis]|uniref:hypothetical protein n=1 Tax=Leptotrichia hongkongensis TaxID=554406 RepID=UPI0035A96DB1